MCVRLNEQQRDPKDGNDKDRSPSPALPSHRWRDEPEEVEENRDDEKELQENVQRLHTIRTYARTAGVPRNASKRKRRPKPASNCHSCSAPELAAAKPACVSKPAAPHKSNRTSRRI